MTKVRDNANPSFFILLTTLVLVRVVSILTYSEAGAFEEGLYRGTIGLEIIEGLKLPLWDYRPDPYSGGPLVVGAMASVFFRLFGPSVFALKLVPLCFDIATLYAVYLLMKNAFDARTAWISCILLILAPSVYVQLSLVAMGFHSESVCFSVWMLYFLNTYRVDRTALWRLVSFAFIGGLSISFSMISAIAVLSAFIYWIAVDFRKITCREIPLAVFSLVLGVIPAITYNLTHNGVTLEFLSTVLPSGFSIDWASILGLVKKSIKLGLSLANMLAIEFRDPFLRTGTGLLYGLISVSAIIIYLKKQGRFLCKKREVEFVWFFIIYFILFTAIYLVIRRFEFNLGKLWTFHFISFRYFYPLLTFFILLTAVAIARLKQPAYFLIPLLLLSSIGNIVVWTYKPTIDVFRSKGYSYRELGYVLVQSSQGRRNPSGWLHEVLAKYPNDRQRFIALGFLENSFFNHGLTTQSGSLQKEAEILAAFPSDYRPWLYEAWGAWHVSNEKFIPFGELEHSLAGLSNQELEFFVKGLAIRWSREEFKPELREKGAAVNWISQLGPQQLRWVSFQHGKDFWRYRNVSGTSIAPENMNATQQKWFWRGFGCALGYKGLQRLKAYFKNLAEPWHQNLTAEDYANIYWGIGWQAREEHSEDPVRAAPLLKTLPQAAIADAKRGVEDYEEFYGLR